MRILRLAALAALCAGSSVFAQTASLAANESKLAPAGGTVAFTATVSYDEGVGALAWSIALPADWTLASVAGPNVPAIASDVGSTGTLEFAYTEVPARRAEFTVLVRYPAGAAAATATPTVLVRSGGKLATLKPAGVEFRPEGAGGTGSQRSRN